MNVKLNCNLDAEDYLNYQLFNASQSKNINIKRKRNRFIPAIVFFVLGIIVPRFDFTEPFTLIYISISVLWIFVYPIWDKRLYINHYKKFINENYQNNFDKNVEVILSTEEVYMKDGSSESKINLVELQEINEVPNAFYLKLKSSQSIILPKSKIGNLNEVKEFLNIIKDNYSVNYNEFPDWKWK